MSALDHPTLRQHGEAGYQRFGKQILLSGMGPTSDIPIRRMTDDFDRQAVLCLGSGRPLASVSGIDVQALHGRVFFNGAGHGIGLCQIGAAERAFMTGVLSLIDVLFETSMDDVVSQLNLADDVRQGLQGRNGYLGLLLMLAERLEENKFSDVLPLLEQLKVKEDVLMAAQLEAIQWTNNLAEIA